MKPSFINELKDLVENGLAKDIFLMEKHYYLVTKISSNGQKIDDFKSSRYSKLFEIFQFALITEVILAVSRIYEPPSKQYPTRCLSKILEKIRKNKNILTVGQKPNLERHLLNSNLDPHTISLMYTDESFFNDRVADYFRELILNEEHQDKFKRLKNIRDKRIAHNEKVSSFDRLTLLDLKELIKTAKQVLGFIGLGYLNTFYVYEGKYFLSDDAQIPSRSLEYLFKELGILT